MSDAYIDLWGATPDPTSEHESGPESDPSIPDGEHLCRVIGFDVFESKAGDIWMKWIFAVHGGMYDGRTLVRMSAPLGKRTDDEDWRRKQITWAKQDLYRVTGSIPPVMDGLLDTETRRVGYVLPRVMGALVRVAKVTKPDRINVYINELAQAAPSLDGEPVSGPVDEPKEQWPPEPEPDPLQIDDIPF
jgi:hypothetical protein